jgi:hypothetical protein
MKTDFVFWGMRINVASQARRRWLLALIYAGFAALIFASLCGYANLLLLLGFVFVARFLGGRNYKGGLIPAFMSGDEREQHRRDHAYFLAYWWWDLALVPAFLAVALKNISYPAAWNPALRLFLDHLPYGLFVAAGILYYTLPQAILLWTEPDMEAEEPAK